MRMEGYRDREADADAPIKSEGKKGQLLIARVRKIVKSGSSYYVALPQSFIKRYNFRPGDQVGVIGSNDQVKVIPMRDAVEEEVIPDTEQIEQN